MSYLFNEEVKDKSFILTFHNNGKLEKAISFSIPPQNFQINQAQRINQTKTFGGIVFDDYGNDIIKINLSGTTVNNQLRLIYTSENNTEEVTGEEEIFKINEVIQEYGKLEKLIGKQVFLYNLNKEEKSHLYWQILIGSFTIKQSKDKPLCYDYSLECTGFPNDRKVLNEKTGNAFVSQIDPEEQSLLNNRNIDKSKNLLDILYSALNSYAEFLDIYYDLNKILDELEKTVNLYANAIKGFIDVSTSYVEETQHLGDKIIKTAFRITMGTGLNIYNSASNYVKAVKNLVLFTRNIPDSVKKTFNSYLFSYAETSDDIVDNITVIVKEIEYLADIIFTNAKKNVGVYDNVIIPGNSDTDDRVETIYGFENYIIKYGDTWASIASNYYGDPSLGSLIASYNEQVSFDTGNTIYIPKLIQDISYQLSEIYNPYEIKNNYGEDIKISTNGDIDICNNDFQTIKGKDNLQQAICNRLTTDINSRIRLITYGIKSKLGSPTLSTSFILASIKQTMAREPRIKSVDKIVFKGMGDRIYISISYTDINNNNDVYGGLI